MTQLDKCVLLKQFVGDFVWIQSLTQCYWCVSFIITLLFVLNYNKINHQKYKLIFDFILFAGFTLTLTYMAFAFIAYIDYIPSANQLGGLTDAERHALFVQFRSIVVHQLCVITIMISCILFARFTLLDYLLYRANNKSKSLYQ